MTRTYHVGLIRGTGPCQCWANGRRKTTVVVQLRRKIDYLSCELWKYLGERCITKRHLRGHKVAMLEAINRVYSATFTHIVID